MRSAETTEEMPSRTGGKTPYNEEKWMWKLYAGLEKVAECYNRCMPGYIGVPSRSAARRLQQEKRRAVLYWTVGLVLLVAAVAGLLVLMYMRQAHG